MKNTDTRNARVVKAEIPEKIRMVSVDAQYLYIYTSEIRDKRVMRWKNIGDSHPTFLFLTHEKGRKIIEELMQMKCNDIRNEKERKNNQPDPKRINVGRYMKAQEISGYKGRMTQ